MNSRERIPLNMYAGQYFVVVQHPMQNGVFDVYASPALASPSTATDTISSYVWTAPVRDR